MEVGQATGLARSCPPVTRGTPTTSVTARGARKVQGAWPRVGEVRALGRAQASSRDKADGGGEGATAGGTAGERGGEAARAHQGAWGVLVEAERERARRI